LNHHRITIITVRCTTIKSEYPTTLDENEETAADKTSGNPRWQLLSSFSPAGKQQEFKPPAAAAPQQQEAQQASSTTTAT
jgi:hypothetical protein